MQSPTHTAWNIHCTEVEPGIGSWKIGFWFSEQLASLKITLEKSETCFFGGPASMLLGRIQALLRNCQVQFSKSGTSANTSVYYQRINLILSCHKNPLEPSMWPEPFPFQTWSENRGNDSQHLSWEVWGKQMGCNAGTNISKNKRTRNVSGERQVLQEDSGSHTIIRYEPQDWSILGLM